MPRGNNKNIGSRKNIENVNKTGVVLNVLFGASLSLNCFNLLNFVSVSCGANGSKRPRTNMVLYKMFMQFKGFVGNKTCLFHDIGH